MTRFDDRFNVRRHRPIPRQDPLRYDPIFPIEEPQVSRHPPRTALRWVVAGLLLLGAGIVLSNLDRIGASLASIGRIGPGHTTDDKVIGLISLGFVGLVIVAVVRLLTSDRSSG